MKRLPFLFFLIAVGAAAQQTSAPDLYQKVLRPTVNQFVAVENTDLHWDALEFVLATGKIALAEPVDGHTVAAVFLGTGTFKVAPDSPIEKQQLQMFQGKDHIDEPITEALFRFSSGDEFQKALGPDVKFQPLASEGDFAELLDDRAKNVAADGLDNAARVLQAALSDPASPTATRLLWVDVKTASGKWLLVQYDPLDAEPVAVWNRASHVGSLEVFTDVWTQFGPTRPTSEPVGWKLDNYDINLDIPENLDLTATATFDLAPEEASGTGVFLGLDSNLRVTTAALTDGTALSVVQPRDPGRMGTPTYEGQWLYLQFPKPLVKGQTVRVKLQYAGKNVIEKVGNGNFFCRSFGWYPTNRLGPDFERANFDIHFKTSKKYTIVGTGVQASSSRDGDFELSEWKSDVPLTVAGFAMGDYKETEKPQTVAGKPVDLQVFVNNQPDDLMSELNLATENRTDMAVGTFDAKNMAPTALTDVGNALQFLSLYYGPYPYAKLSVTTIPGDYGQGWPGLLYLSDLSFMDSTQLHTLGVSFNTLGLLTDMFRAHETSHQWWGHLVSWATYHDQWMSEGFANASALLYQEATSGRNAGQQTLSQWRRELLFRDQLGHVPNDLAPVWLGRRQSSSLDPAGYSVVTYDKGAYVLYMLREMLTDTRKPMPSSDVAFMDMMQDFTKRFANKDASTRDFQTIVEKHMTRVMDVDGNGKMDWFFDRYVYGTAVPHIEFHAQIGNTGGDGKTPVVLHIANPDKFRGVLPVYLFQPDNKTFVRAQLQLRGEDVDLTIPAPFKPAKVAANEFQDMLIDVKQ